MYVQASRRSFAYLAALFAAVSLVLSGTVFAESKPAVKGTSKIEAQVEPIEEDAKTREELKIYESGRWAGQPIPEALDASKLSADERKLYERATARWAALSEFDLAKVYSFATPAYRKTHDQKHLNAQYHNKIFRKGVDIVSLKFSKDDKTEAKLRIKLKFQMAQSSSPQLIDGIAWETDTWVKVDGQWWYVEPK